MENNRDQKYEPSTQQQETREDIKRIDKYSDRKRITKPGPANSTLKPETSSDSPSAKSNGERLVSARPMTQSRSGK